MNPNTIIGAYVLCWGSQDHLNPQPSPLHSGVAVCDGYRWTSLTDP